MAVLCVDAVSVGRCDDCPGERVIVTEQIGTTLVATIIGGCETCEGCALVLARS